MDWKRTSLLAWAFVCGAASAHADDTDVAPDAAPDVAPDGPKGYAWAESAVFVEQNRGPRITAISPLIGAEYWIAHAVEVRARFGWTGVRLAESEFTDRRWRWSNLELGASFRREIPTYYPYVFELAVGLNVEIPTSVARRDTTMAGDLADETVLRSASVMRGRRDPWLWAPETLSIVIPLSAQLVHDHAHVKLAGDLGFLFALDDPDPTVAIQLLGEAGYWVQRKLLLALALSVVTTADNALEGASASGAFRAIAKLDPVRFHFDVWLNLDDPLGFTLVGSRWGVVLGIGVALP